MTQVPSNSNFASHINASLGSASLWSGAASASAIGTPRPLCQWSGRTGTCGWLAVSGACIVCVAGVPVDDSSLARHSVCCEFLRVSARLTRNAIALHLPPRRPEDGSTRLEFKYIVQNPDRSAAQWQPGANREVLLDLTQDVALVQVQDEWSTGKQIVRVRCR